MPHREISFFFPQYYISKLIEGWYWILEQTDEKGSVLSLHISYNVSVCIVYKAISDSLENLICIAKHYTKLPYLHL